MFVLKIQKIVVNLTDRAPPPAHVCIAVCMCVCVWEQERVERSTSSSVCQRSQSPGSLIPLPGGLENFLSSFPVPSPRWARRATPGKFMLMSAMKTPPPLGRVSQYLSNSGLSILFALSLSFFIHLFPSFAVNICILTDSSEKKRSETTTAKAKQKRKCVFSKGLRTSRGLLPLRGLRYRGSRVVSLGAGPIWARLLRCYQHIYPPPLRPPDTRKMTPNHKRITNTVSKSLWFFCRSLFPHKRFASLYCCTSFFPPRTSSLIKS